MFAGIVWRIHWRDGLYHIAGCDVLVHPVLVRPRILPPRIPPRARAASPTPPIHPARESSPAATTYDRQAA